MEFIDLKAQYQDISSKINARIQNVLGHGRFIMGPEVTELEERLAAFVGVKHCVGVSSGTDALIIAMMALGIGPGDEVITTPFSFIATAETIALLGATPVFADIDPATYNIDPALIEPLITPKTRAIMPVSLYGQCADMDAINAIAGKHGLPVIEDGAQSFGATYKGRKSCGLSQIGCTSFFPAKPLGGYGDGGACFTNDDELARLMREIANHGQDRRYHHPRIGLNGRLDTLQAAILLVKLDIFPREVEARARIGASYSQLLQQHGAQASDRSGSGLLVPFIAPDNSSVFAQYTLQADDREAIQAALAAKNIPTAVHYPVPLNAQPALKAVAKPGATPISDRMAGRVFSLPMHPYLNDSDIRRICEAVSEVTAAAA